MKQRVAALGCERLVLILAGFHMAFPGGVGPAGENFPCFLSIGDCAGDRVARGLCSCGFSFGFLN